MLYFMCFRRFHQRLYQAGYNNGLTLLTMEVRLVHTLRNYLRKMSKYKGEKSAVKNWREISCKDFVSYKAKYNKAHYSSKVEVVFIKLFQVYFVRTFGL